MAPGSRDDADNDPLRRAAQYRVDRETELEGEAANAQENELELGAATPDAEHPGTEDVTVQQSIRSMSPDERARYVDTVVDQAMRRGEFDDLPLQGKPIPGLGDTHDPDWWVKGLIERENITGMLPSAQLRAEDAALDDELDREAMEERVREIVSEFNARVVDARRQLQGGPPVVTPTRDVDEEVRRWRDRGAERRRSRVAPTETPRTGSTARPWWKFW